MHFKYLKFFYLNKTIFCLHKGVQISEDALYHEPNTEFRVFVYTL